MTNPINLPLNQNAQAAVMGWILKEKSFALNCKMHLKKDMFIDVFVQEIFTKTVNFFEEYKTLPSIENLANLFFHDKQYNIYRQKIFDCEAQSKNFPLNYLTKEITAWIQLNIYKKTLHKSIDAYNKNQEEMIKTIFHSTLDEIAQVKFNGNLEYQFGNPLQDIVNSNKVKHNSVTTGLKELDEMFGGGLFRGEHTVLIAPYNVGKTTVCINLLFHNIALNKHCLFITHEMAASKIVDKIRQRMLYKTYQEYLQMATANNAEEQEILQKAEQKLIKYLTYIPYCRAGGMYVEDVIDIIRQKNLELYNREGKYYDLIIDDYPGKLTSKTMQGYKEIRHSLRFVYEQFHQLALEFDCHAISPAQTNRSGSERNKQRESKNKDYLGGEDIGEAFAIMQDADNGITLNRSVEDAEKGLMTFFIDKTRTGVAKKALEVKTDFSRGITHDQRLQDNYLKEKAQQDESRRNALLKGTADLIKGGS